MSPSQSQAHGELRKRSKIVCVQHPASSSPWTLAPGQRIVATVCPSRGGDPSPRESGSSKDPARPSPCRPRAGTASLIVGKPGCGHDTRTCVCSRPHHLSCPTHPVACPQSPAAGEGGWLRVGGMRFLTSDCHAKESGAMLTSPAHASHGELGLNEGWV